MAKRVEVSQTKTNYLFVLALDHFQIQSKEKVSLLACAADAPLEFHFCVRFRCRTEDEPRFGQFGQNDKLPQQDLSNDS